MGYVQTGRAWKVSVGFDMCHRDVLIGSQATNLSEVERDEGCGSAWQTETCKGC